MHVSKEYILEKFSNGVHYILLDDKTINSITANGNKRAICQLNDEVEFHCAVMPKRGGGFFVNIGSAVCKKLGIAEGSYVKAVFFEDKSRYQFEMPDEFIEVLNSDPIANTAFQSLTKGNQRGLIYLVAQAKSVDKRIERALKIAERMKQGITSPRIILK